MSKQLVGKIPVFFTAGTRDGSKSSYHVLDRRDIREIKSLAPVKQATCNELENNAWFVKRGYQLLPSGKKKSTSFWVYCSAPDEYRDVPLITVYTFLKRAEFTDVKGKVHKYEASNKQFFVQSLGWGIPDENYAEHQPTRVMQFQCRDWKISPLCNEEKTVLDMNGDVVGVLDEAPDLPNGDAYIDPAVLESQVLTVHAKNGDEEHECVRMNHIIYTLGRAKRALPSPATPTRKKSRQKHDLRRFLKKLIVAAEDNMELYKLNTDMNKKIEEFDLTTEDAILLLSAIADKTVIKMRKLIKNKFKLLYDNANFKLRDTFTLNGFDFQGYFRRNFTLIGIVLLTYEYVDMDFEPVNVTSLMQVPEVEGEGLEGLLDTCVSAVNINAALLKQPVDEFDGEAMGPLCSAIFQAKPPTFDQLKKYQLVIKYTKPEHIDFDLNEFDFKAFFTANAQCIKQLLLQYDFVEENDMSALIKV